MSKYDPLGADMDRGGELYEMDLDGPILSKITALGYADRTGQPSVSVRQPGCP